MQLTLNGKSFSSDLPLPSLLHLLTSLSIQPETVVIELNNTLYKHPEFQHMFLSEGDCIEVVHFVGGGS